MSKNKNVDSAKTTELNTILGKGSIFKGDLIAQHSMRVDGTVKGTIEANGFLVVGKEGVVEGEIKVGNVIVGGTVKGNIDAKGKVLLEANSSLQGDMRTSKLVIEEGATFEGKCFMGESKQENKHKSDKKKENWEFKPIEENQFSENKLAK